ncbi:MAG: class II aldolase/adducin family protein [Proteobacteria bacterium]|nr:class II aldolase/adducin family protein [Pseudomonadota bacterium]
MKYRQTAAPNERTIAVPDPLADLRHEIALANRILAHEGVLDAFGHVSARHPRHPDRYLLSRSRAPELVEPGDIVEFSLDSAPLAAAKHLLYAERVIHGEIYRARPDVMAVCHHHSPAIMPFVIAAVAFTPVFHLGAVCGATVPFWDQREDFGDTNLLVVKAQEGASLARALGRHALVFMRNHGATVVGDNLRQLAFRAIYTSRNAEYQQAAGRLGTPRPLTAGEIAKAAELSNLPTAQMRAWEYWAARVGKAGGLPARGQAAKNAAAAARAQARAALRAKTASRPRLKKGEKRR